MISFADLTLDGGSPIYLQLIRYLKRGIAAGTIEDGDELPSRRVVSALLGVNPNTVQKAYRLLEEEGLIQSRSGAKSCVVLGPDATAQVRSQLLAQDALALVTAMKQMGLSKSEALDLIETHWDRGEKNEKT